MRATRPIDRGHIPSLLQRLESYHLVTSPSSDRYIIQLTPHGTDVARHSGGYLGHKTEEASKQQKAQAEQLKKDEIEREAALATAAAAKSSASATKAAWVSAAVAVMALVISLFLNNSLDKTNSQVEALTKRVQTLEAQTKPQRQHPERP